MRHGRNNFWSLKYVVVCPSLVLCLQERIGVLNHLTEYLKTNILKIINDDIKIDLEIVSCKIQLREAAKKKLFS